MTRTYFVYHGDGIEIRALLGPMVQTIRFGDSNGLEVSGGKVYLRRQQSRKRIHVYRFLSNGDDWRAFEEAVGTRPGW